MMMSSTQSHAESATLRCRWVDRTDDQGQFYVLEVEEPDGWRDRIYVWDYGKVRVQGGRGWRPAKRVGPWYARLIGPDVSHSARPFRYKFNAQVGMQQRLASQFNWALRRTPDSLGLHDPRGAENRLVKHPGGLLRPKK
jgi:hypothetical protein